MVAVLARKCLLGAQVLPEQSSESMTVQFEGIGSGIGAPARFLRGFALAMSNEERSESTTNLPAISVFVVKTANRNVDIEYAVCGSAILLCDFRLLYMFNNESTPRY